MSTFLVTEQSKIEDFQPLSIKECFLIDLFNYEYCRPVLVLSQNSITLQRLEKIAQIFKNLSCLTFSHEIPLDWSGKVVHFDAPHRCW